MIQTELEGQVREWLDRFEISYDFQSTLVGGRHEWSGLQAPFIIAQAGLVFRILDDINMGNPEDRAIIENFGYRVVDLEEVDLRDSFDIAMLRAIQGEEMSPIDSGLYKTGLFASKGFESHPEDGSGKVKSSQVSPTIRTDVPSDIASGLATLNGTLTYDGGYLCDGRFHYGGADIDESPLCILFPWAYHSLINMFSPEINLSFATISSNESGITNWQGKYKTDDSFDSDVSLNDGWNYVKAEAKNQSYNAEGNSILFMVGD